MYEICTICNILGKTWVQSVKWNFLETSIKTVQRSLNLLFQGILFWCYLFFKNVSTARLEPTKWQTGLFIILVFQNQHQGYILSYFINLLRVLSPSRDLAEFCLTCIIHDIWGKMLQFMVFTFLENALNLCIFTHTLVPHAQNARQDFLKACFPQDNRGRENYDLLYQNSIMKYEDNLEH